VPEEVSPDVKLYVKEQAEEVKRSIKDDIENVRAATTRTFSMVAVVVGLLTGFGVYKLATDYIDASIEKVLEEKSVQQMTDEIKTTLKSVKEMKAEIQTIYEAAKRQKESIGESEFLFVPIDELQKKFGGCKITNKSNIFPFPSCMVAAHRYCTQEKKAKLGVVQEWTKDYRIGIGCIK
jgi:hypothetical protein